MDLFIYHYRFRDLGHSSFIKSSHLCIIYIFKSHLIIYIIHPIITLFIKSDNVAQDWSSYIGVEHGLIYILMYDLYF